MPFLLICLVGLLVSVYASPVSPPMVAGQVRLANGSPVAGAQVVLFDVADLRRGRVGQATTDEAGQFALPLPTGGGALVLPREVGLGPNYPNPFNPSTLIPYQLPAPSPVRLEVFNVLGQRVATLVDGPQEAGAYRARWDGTDAAGRAAAAGVYFYRLTVAGAHWTGKMVLVDGQAGVPLAGARVEAVSRAAGSTEMGRYGLVVVREGLVVHVDSDFVVASGTGSVVLDRAARPNRAGKRVASLDQGVLGDVDNNGRVELDDGLLAAMLSVDPALSLPNRGVMALGDVDCDGRVESADAALIATYVANPSDASVSARRIGQRGGYSLKPVTEVVWASILGTEKQDATVAQILDGVPVLISGVFPSGSIDGPDHLYLGIGRAYWTQQGGKHIYAALKQRFPATPISVAPSTGIIRHAGKVVRRPTTTALRQVAPVTRFGPPISFGQAPNTALADNGKAPQVVGSITVPDSVTVGSVAVDVDITHPAPSDLTVELVAPSGVVMTLHDGMRSGINSRANLVVEESNLTQLQGQAAHGTWQLRVGDYAPGDTGTLNTWSLTITPAQDVPETYDPAHLFLDTFQEGLGAWRGSKWQAASLSADATVPGEGPGNVVAKAGTGCRTCFLTLETPVDLSAYDSVTLSFYRYLDPGMGNDEFLGVDIGNHGAYHRLKNWDGRHADSQWRRETFTLSGDDISDSFSLRFFSVKKNIFTAIAVDNVMITAVPGSIVVEPEPDQTETDPDLSVISARATETTIAPGQPFSIQATVMNTDAPTATRTVSFYRHDQKTVDPQTGAPVIASARTILQKNSTGTVSADLISPTVPGTYHYYSCINTIPGEDTDNNCASVIVTVTEPETLEDDASGTGISVTLVTEVTEIVPGVKQDVSLTATVTNNGPGSITLPSYTITFHRHDDEKTDTPAKGGETVLTVEGGSLSLASSESFSETIDDYDFKYEGSLPTNYPNTYYYYACFEDICSRAVEVPVQISPVMVTDIVATPIRVFESDPVTITATITNTGMKTDGATISIYRTDNDWTRPTDGVKESNTITLDPLVPNTSVVITSTHIAPPVDRGIQSVFYHVCVNDLSCTSEPAQVMVRELQEDPGPPYEGCNAVPVRLNPMGGDKVTTHRQNFYETVTSCTTITLGGVEDVNGVRGFIASGHGSVDSPGDVKDYSHSVPKLRMSHDRYHILGTVFKLPSYSKDKDSGFLILGTDSAFIAYPSRYTPNCPSDMIMQQSGGESFCAKIDIGNQVERLEPLKIRGEGGAIYTVIGAREAIKGETIWISGSVSGQPLRRIAQGEDLLLGGRSPDGIYLGFAHYSLIPLDSKETIGGDSGAPVYTTPDEDGNVYLTGVHIGTGSATIGDFHFNVHSSWKSVVDEFDLVPIKPLD